MKLCGILNCENYAMSNIDVCDTHRREQKKALSKVEKPKRKALPKFSKKRKEEMPQYKALRDTFMKEHPDCQAKLIGCSGKATECHHAGKRGKNYLNVKTFMALCNNCHSITERVLSAQERRNLKLLI